MIVELTKGYTTEIDDADWPLLSKTRWYAVVLKRTGRVYARNKYGELMHRVILGIADSKIQADHIDGNPLNNRRDNLRECTPAQNNMNQGPRRTATSGYRGVHPKKGSSRWYSTLKINGKLIRLGTWSTKELAAKAYNRAARAYYGEFAYQNQV